MKETKEEDIGSKDERNDFEVFWDDPPDQDPANPMNWSTARKWTIVAIVSFITFLTYVPSKQGFDLY